MGRNDSNELHKHRRRLYVLFIGALIVGGLVLLPYFLRFHGEPSDDQSVWGVFGDYVGGTLNPIFALFALFALLYTIVLQVQELQAVRKELKKTTKTARLQNFEHTFFQMIRLHHAIVDRIDLLDDHSEVPVTQVYNYRGRSAIKVLCERLDRQLLIADMVQHRGDTARLSQDVINAWNRFFDDAYPLITHYFRNFYALLKLVKDRAPDDDVAQYVGIIQAQVSVHELKLLFYNALQPTTATFKQLFEDTAFLSALRIMLFAVQTHGEINPEHLRLYDRRAYGNFDPEELWNREV